MDVEPHQHGQFFMTRQRQGARQDKTVTFDAVRRLALALPKVQEVFSYGTPGFKVAGKLFARFHQDGEAVVVRIDSKERAMRMRADPHAFFITDHYLNYPWMLVRLSAVRLDDLRDLLQDAWRLRAPQKYHVKREG
jgi:hypothetical protein